MRLLKCGYCNVDFEAPQYEINRRKKRGIKVPYCSRKCTANGTKFSKKRKTFEERFWEKVHKTKNCWIWSGHLDKDGYGHIKKDKKKIGAHRAAYELFNGDIPNGLLVCHSCDNPSCVNPDHLWLGTFLDNNLDSKNKERNCFGENNKRAKLRKEQVLKIRSTNLSNIELGKIFNISPATIWAIKTNKIWKHLL